MDDVMDCLTDPANDQNLSRCVAGILAGVRDSRIRYTRAMNDHKFPLGLCIGLTIGIIFGVVIDKIAVGMGFGVAFGVAIGMVLSSNSEDETDGE